MVRDALHSMCDLQSMSNIIVGDSLHNLFFQKRSGLITQRCHFAPLEAWEAWALFGVVVDRK